MKARIKIDGKYYVADDTPTTTVKSKALVYQSKKEAKRDAEVIKTQWGLEDKQITIS